MLGNIRKPNEIVDAPIFNFIKPGANDSLSRKLLFRIAKSFRI